MTLTDRIRRWWNPGKWRDKHAEVSDGEGFALSGEQAFTDTAPQEVLISTGRGAIDLGRER
jgi:hypothetical protein